MSSERYYSQYRQDKFLDQKVFRGKRGGVFVDIGADDGIELNNTCFFEKNRGWTGICIEPRESAFLKLKQNRSCTCERLCVSNVKGSAEFLQIEGSGAMLSGLVDTYHENHEQRIVEQHGHEHMGTITVPCEPLSSILQRHHISHVDYCSIDTEGSEEMIVSAIDFSTVSIDVLTIENNYGNAPIRRQMRSCGYLYAGSLGCDDVFVHRRIARGLRLTILAARTHTVYRHYARRLEHLKVLAYNALKKLGIVGRNAHTSQLS